MVNLAAVLGGGVFALIGLGAMWQGYNRLGRTGEVSTGGATAVRDLQPGEWTQVEGTAGRTEANPLPAQIAGTEGFVVETEVLRNSTNNRLAHRQLDAVPFELDDGTGAVRVDPPEDIMDYAFGFGQGAIGVPGKVETTRAEYHLDETVVDDFDGVPDGVQAWADTQAEHMDRLPNSLRECRQGVVEPGDSVVVYGKVGRHPDANPGSPSFTIDGGGDPDRFVLSDAGVQAIDSTVSREEYARFGFALLSLLVGFLFIGVGVIAG